MSAPAVASEVNLARAQGVWAPAVTPLKSDLTIDTESAVAHIRNLLQAGSHGVVLFGTTGEATSFSIEERMELLDKLLEAGIPARRLLVGTGCAALPDSLRLTRQAVERDCLGVLMLPPYYYKNVSDEGLYASYAEVIDRIGSIDLRLYFYHFPRLSMVPITHAVIERLLKTYPETIQGLKDSSGDQESCAAFIKSFPELAIFPGTETLLLPMLRLGGVGTITATANINMMAIRSLYDTWLEGNEEEAIARQDAITAVRAAIQAYPMIPALKSVLSEQHGMPEWSGVRPPLTPLPEGERSRLFDALRNAGFEPSH